ncbi:MAG: dethiobiotin synthase [Rhodospirillales bacterium]
MDGERALLAAHADAVREGFARIGIDTAGSTTQIVPALVGDAAAALALADALRARGVLAVAIRPPTVPAATSRIRFALSAAHDAAAIEKAGGRNACVLAASANGGLMTAGVFVTGTDTGVGKTVVCACLVRRWGAHYWKPAQTGLAEEAGDTETVARLAGRDRTRWHAPRFAFGAPLSVEAAAARENVTVSLADFELPAVAGPIVVEGAGGVLVPLGRGALMVDLMARFALPVVLVARTTLGTINHTLLSLEVLRGRGLRVAGVVLVGDASAGNRDAIARHGNVRILHEMERLRAISPAEVAQAAALFPDLAEVVETRSD